MTIRNRIAGYIFREKVIAYKKPTNKPEIVKDVGIRAFACDVMFRKLGGVATTCTQGVTFRETPVQEKIDWKCDYCGCLRPSHEYECGYCGAPRTEYKKDKSKDWEPDKENIGSVYV